MSPYLTHLIIVYCIFAILILGFAVTLGWLGISNLAHVAFASVGAYTTAVLTTQLDAPVWFGIVLGTAFGALFSVVISLLIRRVRGDFVVVLALGVHYAVLVIAQNWTSVTRGTLGIPGIPRPAWFDEPGRFIILSVVALAVVYLVLERLTRSPFGKLMALIRDDDVAAQALGKNTVQTKVLGLLVAGAVAGLAGAFAAHYFQFLDPKTFHLGELVFVISATIVGGLGSLPGALLGTAILFFVPELLRFVNLPDDLIGPLRQMLFSLVLLAVLVYRPKGILGKIAL